MWKNVSQASKNPSHQTIHLKIVHRTYLTPKLRHLMKLETPLPTPHARYYRYFYTYVLGMPWSTVWSQVTKYLSKILNKVVPCCPVLCLSNDNSQFPMSIHDKRIWISGHAAKEMLVVRWKPPHTLSLDHWWHLLLDILTLELLVAQSHGATDKTLKSWSEAIAETKKKKNSVQRYGKYI